MIKIGNKLYLTPKDYAKQNYVSEPTVYNWIRKGKVPSRKLLGKFIVEI